MSSQKVNVFLAQPGDVDLNADQLTDLSCVVASVLGVSV